MFSLMTDDEKTVFVFFKEMNTENCLSCMNEVIEKTNASKKPVVFDMKKIEYIASVFLSMCIQIHKERGSQNFRLQNLHPNVKKVFKIAKLDSYITIA
ncbi:MAG: STAS domain-containing protein [Candidatus Omnitrophica bacterium]|nr:STAS domain-containing protein [Candidatus Omnitrophota bacterium]